MNRFNIPWRTTAFSVLLACISVDAATVYAQTPEPPSRPSGLTAAATSPNTIELNWSGVKADKVDIYRGDSLLTAPETNDGTYTDNINRKDGGSYLYKVCKAGSEACSNIASVIF